ncbi:MAG: hypothetical protein LBM28_03970 [Oscillospiraceae bacterium]|jgi:hypothetical protein|nr:hypothetical protein [Oscillospiraceae bacterium]
MLKRSVWLLVCIFALSLTAFADVVWRNAFLEEVREESVVLERNSYMVNSDSGSLTGKEEPRTDAASWGRTYENGEVLSLDKVYEHDGAYWGIYDEQGHADTSGWFPMDQLLVMYDDVAFYADHEEEFYAYSGEFHAPALGETLVAWPWPGAGYANEAYTVANQIQIDNSSRYIIIHEIEVQYAYKDSEGREWGFVEMLATKRSYNDGGWGAAPRTMETWICLSEPSNENIPAFNPAPPPAAFSPEVKHVHTEEEERSMLFLIILLVLALLVGTAALIRAFWKPKKV